VVIVKSDELGSGCDEILLEGVSKGVYYCCCGALLSNGSTSGSVAPEASRRQLVPTLQFTLHYLVHLDKLDNQQTEISSLVSSAILPSVSINNQWSRLAE
jgi:hypothetical protein